MTTTDDLEAALADQAPAPRSELPFRVQGAHSFTGRTPLGLVSERLWALMQPLVERYDPEARRGTHRCDDRLMFEAIVAYALNDWSYGSDKLDVPYPSSKTVWYRRRRWEACGLLEKLVVLLMASVEAGTEQALVAKTPQAKQANRELAARVVNRQVVARLLEPVTRKTGRRRARATVARAGSSGAR